METVLVVGVDGVVGANLAAVCTSSRPVVGITKTAIPSALGHVLNLAQCTPAVAGEIVRKHVVQRIVYCGAAADSCWDRKEFDETERESVDIWLQVASAARAAFTLISSDAVFTGPWMFHAENGQSHCQSAEARLLRDIEERVLAQRPDALVVRTHAFGWGPAPLGQTSSSWLDRLTARDPEERLNDLDGIRHASPILASDLAEILQKAWGAGLVGIYHIAGAERTNPLQFAQRVTQQFGVGFPATRPTGSLCDAPRGFGRGESSLQTRKVRRALGLGMPLLSEGLERFHQQSLNGFRERLQGTARMARAA